METIGERVERLRIEAELSQEQLARAAGVSQGTISQQESIPTRKSKHLDKIANALSTTVEYLVTGKTLPRQVEMERATYDDAVVFVPFIDAQVSAGDGITNQTEEIKELHQFTRSWIDRNGYHAPALRRVKVAGRSMERTLFDGDVVLVNTADKRIINGKVYSFLVDGEARVKRLYKQMDGKIRVVSDNADKQEFPDENLTPDHMPEMIGRVVDRSGKADL